MTDHEVLVEIDSKLDAVCALLKRIVDGLDGLRGVGHIVYQPPPDESVPVGAGVPAYTRAGMDDFAPIGRWDGEVENGGTD